MWVASEQNIKNRRILMKYKDYVDVCKKDTATLAPHLSTHPKGILVEERRRKRVRGNDRVPGCEEPHKLLESTKSWNEPVRPRVGKNRAHHCHCVWTTELAIKAH